MGTNGHQWAQRVERSRDDPGELSDSLDIRANERSPGAIRGFLFCGIDDAFFAFSAEIHPERLCALAARNVRQRGFDVHVTRFPCGFQSETGDGFERPET